MSLRQRKQALIAESALRRIELRLELESIRASTARWTGALSSPRRIGPWLITLAAIIGAVAGNKFRKSRPAAPRPHSLFSMVRLSVGLIPTLLSLWRRFAPLIRPPRF